MTVRGVARQKRTLAAQNPKIQKGKRSRTIAKNNMKTILKRMAVMTMVLVLLLAVLVSCGGGGTATSTLKRTDIKLTPLMVQDTEPELDAEGNPVLDENGNQVYKPKVDENGNPVMVQAKDENGNRLFENKLSSTELASIADMLIKANAADYTVQSMLIAAANGFAMAQIDSGENDPLAYKDIIDEGVYTPGGEDDIKDEVINIRIEDVKDPKSLALRLRLVRNVIFEANTRSEQKLGDDILYNKLGYSTDANGTPNYDHNNAGEYLNAADVRALIDCFKITITPSAPGVIDTILLWIGKVVAWITDTICFGSYLAGICIFAIIIEILMLPFAIKQQKNSIRQAKLRPMEMAIRNKYKGRNDQATMQKMQQEIQAYYQKENFSPYSGCLTLVIQLPIIMALYNIIINPLHYMLGQSNEVVAALNTYAATPMVAGGAGMNVSANSSTISLLAEFGKDFDVSSKLGSFEFFSIDGGVLNSLESSFASLPDFNVMGINFGMAPALGTINILLLVPILTFAAYFFTSKLNRKLMNQQPVATSGAEAQQVACSNSMMDITMPLMSTFFTFMVPALVGVYWIFRSLVSLLKQFIISKFMPIPPCTEEDIKAAERAMKGKSPRANKPNENKVRAVRSLHYIDDEDFEDTRERGRARREAIEERERAEQEKQDQQRSTFSAPLKEKREEKPVEKSEKTEEKPEERPEEKPEEKLEEKTENSILIQDTDNKTEE